MIHYHYKSALLLHVLFEKALICFINITTLKKKEVNSLTIIAK